MCPHGGPDPPGGSGGVRLRSYTSPIWSGPVAVAPRGPAQAGFAFGDPSLRVGLTCQPMRPHVRKSVMPCGFLACLSCLDCCDQFVAGITGLSSAFSFVGASRPIAMGRGVMQYWQAANSPARVARHAGEVCSDRATVASAHLPQLIKN